MAYASDNESIESLQPPSKLPPKLPQFTFKRHVIVKCLRCYRQVLPLKEKQAKAFEVRKQISYFKRDATSIYFMCVKNKAEYNEWNVGIWRDFSCLYCHKYIGKMQEGKSRYMFKISEGNISCQAANKYQLPSSC